MTSTNAYGSGGLGAAAGLRPESGDARVVLGAGGASGAETTGNAARGGTRSRTAHIDYLDGWRGIAIALVLEEHFFGVLPTEDGRFGVDAFFCLSGFLMSGLLFVHRQPLTTFYKRRISRILPAFVAFVLVAFAVATALAKPFTGGEFVSTLLFLRTYLPASPGIWEPVGVPIGHLWSLNVEEHGYLLMSGLVLLPALRGREGPLLIGIGCLCMTIGCIYVGLGSAAPHWGALGTEVAAAHLMLAAGYRLVREKHRIVVPPWLPLLTLLLAACCYLRTEPWWETALFSPVLLAFTINHLDQTPGAFRSLLSVAPLRSLGIWSYSIYLWQQPFYFFKRGFPGGTLTALPLALTVALLSFYALERPCRAWLNARW